MATRAFPFAAVILAPRATARDASTLARLVDAARAAGADPIVVAGPRELAAPPGARVVSVPGRRVAGRSDSPARERSVDPGEVTALRVGMAQLSNTPARYALLLRLEASIPDTVELLALVDAVKRSGAVVSALDGGDLERSPLLVARDAWLELMTLAEQGIGTVAARHGVHRVPR